MTYSVTWKRPAGLACTGFDLAIRLRCVRNWYSLGCCNQEHVSNTSPLGFPILIAHVVFVSAGFMPPRLPSIRAQSASFELRIVKKIDLAENTRYCQVGLKDATPTLRRCYAPVRATWSTVAIVLDFIWIGFYE